mmetsp:Transcript_55556/g.159787  ORF Transcript_55556/g.159787 Transcript_55556/m.159787 type:complete len:684 (+) Transcript_55556:127-2178(+)
MVNTHVVFQEVFDCVGRDFPSDWGRLYEALLDPGARHQGRKVAQATIVKWRNRTAAAWHLVLPVLLGQASQRELQGVCVHGYCAAVHFVSRSGTYGRPFWRDAAECASFGGEWPTYHFLGESRWGSLLSGAEISRPPRRRTRLLAQRLASELAPPADGLGLSFRRSGRGPEQPSPLSTDRYLHDYRLQLVAALAVTLPPLPPGGASPLSSGRAAGGEVNFAAFGVHFTTLMEPIAAMRRVLPRSLRVNAVFHGSSHPPPEMLIQEVCPDREDESPEGFRCYLSTTPGDRFWMDITERASMSEALSVLAGTVMINTFIKNADCLVCGGGHSPTLCLMLRMVTGMPLFFNLQAPITFRMPSDQDTRAMLVAYFRELARPTLAASPRGRTVVSTSLIFFQRQYWVQTGCLLPIVRNHNLYVSEALRNAGPEAAASPQEKEVLFWQNHVALKADFCLVLWRFVKQTVLDAFPYKMVFKNMASMPTARSWRKVYGLSDQESMMLSYSALSRRFAAAVLFPHDLGMISFDDLYVIGIPIFMPANELIVTMAMAHMSSTKNYPWYMLREEHADLPTMHADVGAPLPWEPGWAGRDAVNSTGRVTYLGRGVQHEPDRLLSAVSVSNFALFPHVRRFWSLAGLLRDLALLSPEDFAATGAAMRQTSEEAWEVTSEFYRRAASHLLGVELATA